MNIPFKQNYTMPKSISQPKLKNEKHKKLKSIELIHERTRKAIQYYSKIKKVDLQQAKVRYLQKIGVENIRCKSIEQMTEKSNGELRSQHLLRQSTPKKHMYKQDSSLESQEQIIPINSQQQSQQDSVQSEESYLSEVNKYPLREIHYTILQVQKIVDNFIDFHYTNRNKRSIPKQQLINFLKTTKYSLNCQKYINYLDIYNKKLYKWSEGRIYCKGISGKQSQERYLQTKQRMGRKKIKELDIIFN